MGKVTSYAVWVSAAGASVVAIRKRFRVIERWSGATYEHKKPVAGDDCDLVYECQSSFEARAALAAYREIVRMTQPAIDTATRDLVAARLMQKQMIDSALSSVRHQHAENAATAAQP